MIKADEMFDEMDEEIAEVDEVAAELDEIALNAFESATSRRQIDYEYEADNLGIIYAYRSGYDPTALVRVLQRIKINTSRDFWNPESNWTYDAVGTGSKRSIHSLSGNSRNIPNGM
jgi:predicted Zn-dependent protease